MTETNGGSEGWDHADRLRAGVFTIFAISIAAWWISMVGPAIAEPFQASTPGVILLGIGGVAILAAACVGIAWTVGRIVEVFA